MDIAKNNIESKDEFAKALLASLTKAYVKMLKEKMLHGYEVVTVDDEGNIIHADPKDLYEKMLLNGYKE
ncbi:MAG: hypothetical protein MJZ19_06315 [Paludibacteraceae bacterium]|nr:hypothetical protein [Paludibacteraceae bacterium]